MRKLRKAVAAAVCAAFALSCGPYLAACVGPSENGESVSDSMSEVISADSVREDDSEDSLRGDSEISGDASNSGNSGNSGDSSDSSGSGGSGDSGDSGDSGEGQENIGTFAVEAEASGPDGREGLSVTGGGNYRVGERVTLSAQPLLGYEFLGWYEGDELACADPSYTFPMPGRNVRCFARFGVREDMRALQFTSSLAECTVTGLADPSAAEAAIPDCVTGIAENAFTGCTGLKEAEIGAGVTEIAARAFYGCSSLTELTLGERVSRIGGDAFFGCPLEKVNYAGDMVSWCTIRFDAPESGGAPFGDGYALYFGGVLLSEAAFPDGLMKPGDYTFAGCVGLRSAIVPASMTAVGDCAFYGCVGLERVYYCGTAEEWRKISFGEGNEALKGAAVYYYSEKEPPLNGAGTGYEGAWWHYGADGAPVVWEKAAPQEPEEE